MHHGGGILLDGIPVICGGYGSSELNKECYFHNKVTNAWKLLGNMKNVRSEFGFALLNGGLWVTGGYAPSLTTKYIYQDSKLLAAI